MKFGHFTAFSIEIMFLWDMMSCGLVHSQPGRQNTPEDVTNRFFRNDGPCLTTYVLSHPIRQ
jgi:hypothetical protein